MSNGAYAGLRLAARAGNQNPENNPNELEDDGDDDDAGTSPKPGKGKSKKKEEAMSQEALDKAHAEGMQAATTRFSAVMASEHYAGRETLAANLLGNIALSADNIISALAAAPKAAPVASDTASTDANAEEAARTEMRNAIQQSANSNIDPNGGTSGGEKKENFAGLWDTARASLTPNGRR